MGNNWALQGSAALKDALRIVFGFGHKEAKGERWTDKTPAARDAAPSPKVREPQIFRRYEQGHTVYTIYDDGSIGMATPYGAQRFPTMNEMKAFVTAQQSLADFEANFNSTYKVVSVSSSQRLVKN